MTAPSIAGRSSGYSPSAGVEARTDSNMAATHSGFREGLSGARAPAVTEVLLGTAGRRMDADARCVFDDTGGPAFAGTSLEDF